MDLGHRQHDYRVRFDWGLDGASAIAEGADVAVVVDVLSFTTTLSVAADRGVVVLPYRWRDDGAGEYARRHDAVLAVGRSAEAKTGQVSLSPAGIRAHPHPPARLVLPSPNGSSIAHQLRDSGVVVVAACLRNASAVAGWLDCRRPEGERIAVIAAGERWPNGGLRPAVEDGWGAGAVIAELARLGWSGFSPEADFVAASYDAVRGRELINLKQCASGRELVTLGFSNDVDISAELDQTSLVPVLSGDAFQSV